MLIFFILNTDFQFIFKWNRFQIKNKSTSIKGSYNGANPDNWGKENNMIEEAIMLLSLLLPNSSNVTQHAIVPADDYDTYVPDICLLWKPKSTTYTGADGATNFA